MQTHLTHHAAQLLSALRRRFTMTVVPAVTDGQEARWRAQQRAGAERERALYQLRALGWPSA